MTCWIEFCPDCQQGRLFVMKFAATGAVFLLCEECESAWGSPDSISKGRGDFDFGQGRRDFTWDAVEAASADDVRKAGWSELLRE